MTEIELRIHSYKADLYCQGKKLDNDLHVNLMYSSRLNGGWQSCNIIDELVRKNLLLEAVGLSDDDHHTFVNLLRDRIVKYLDEELWPSLDWSHLEKDQYPFIGNTFDPPIVKVITIPALKESLN